MSKKNTKKKPAKKKIEKKKIKKVTDLTSSKSHEEEILERVKKEVEKEKKFGKSKKRNSKNKAIFLGLIIPFVIATINYILVRKIASSIIIFFVIIILLRLYKVFKEKLSKIRRVRKIETVFPDFIELMSSNLRAGMTTDKALVLSARREFAPLDKEIIHMGKDIMAGKEISKAMSDMAKRINSDIIKKTVTVINSGIKSGGNLAVLLEQTAANMREKQFVEKKAASSVLMYQIFIFFAVGVGAPTLFSLSSVLVQVLKAITSDLPDVSSAASSLPISLSQISISIPFVNYFSLALLAVMGILASLLLGLVNKGEEKEGMKYMFPILAISFTIFFLLKYVLAKFFSEFLA